MLPNKYYRFISKSIWLTALILFIAACSNDDSNGGGSSQSSDAYWKISSTVKSASGSSAIIITGIPGTIWNAEITEGTTWCSFSSNDLTLSSKSGEIKDGLNVLYVYYNSNTGKEQRVAKVSLQFADQEAKVFDLVQLSESQQNLPAFNLWAEVPDFKENANYQYVTHYALLNNKTIRNYSGERTDRWAFDPNIPQSYQADCTLRSYGGSYDRGHQLPSADRLGTDEMNAQTFYMSNMTPQLNRLNQDMWAKLETKVRANNCSDTLYVVTGAYFGAGATTTTDGARNTVPVPTNYFKVLLRTKSGKTGKNIKDCSDSELISIGFWVDHKSYGNIEPPKSICTSVADIEKMTGFTFFPQVSNSVKQQNNPTQWGIN